MSTYATYRMDKGMYALLVGILCAWALAFSACGAKQYPQSRPKYGDSTQPVGPDKSHFRSQPKFQP